MSRINLHLGRTLSGLVLVAVLLAGCAKQEAEAPVASQASAETALAAEQASTPEAVVEPDEVAMVDLPVVKVSGSAVPSEPELGSMQLAAATSEKMGVPVDLRYQIDGDALSGQPVTVHLAAVPRSAGTNLEVSIKEEAGLQFPKAASINAEKAEAGAAYRRQVTLTRTSDGPQELRVLVTMDFPIGKGFTWYSVPLGGAAGK